MKNKLEISVISKIQDLLNQNLSFACFSLPNTRAWHFIFNTSKGNKKFVIQSWNKEKFVLQSSTYYTIDIEDLSSLSFTNNFKSNCTYECSKKEFSELVNSIKSAIQQSNLKKVVASRIVKTHKSNSFNISKILSSLGCNYQNAFKYFFCFPKEQIAWIGASPEKLLIQKRNIASTMSLAGTQPYSNNIKWSEKEFEEQKLVTYEITNVLESLNLKYDVQKLKNQKAGHLAHLCNEISIELNSLIESDILVNKLHPTPAIAGLPKTESVNFINSNEKHNRAFYTGLLGVENFFETNYYFVNLRCMQIFKDSLSIYVGAGITSNSVAENEWQETKSKANVLLNVLSE